MNVRLHILYIHVQYGKTWKRSLTFEYVFPPLSSCNENRKSVKFRNGTVRRTEHT